MLKKKRRQDIYAIYRRILKMANLSNKKIDEMQRNIGLVAQIICEHIWKKKFY
jgi:hypothetical protein